ncbi:MAG: hypothetical protein M0P74_10665 [Syntrophales bacterium]|jgi:hypothetical protein|nr:hypothetical protein [Syntrophales bacterium]
MAEIVAKKKREPFGRRVLCPVGVALGVWVLLNGLTSHLEWFGNGGGYRAAAAVLYPLLGISITCSSIFVYSVMYIRGASLKERVFWAYIVPGAFVLKEIWRVSAFFSPGESFYYAFAPLTLGVLLAPVGFLSLCEMFWRWRDKQRGEATRIATSGPVAGLVFWGITVFFMLFWGSAEDTPGSKWFYLYMEGYKALFVR